MPSQKLTTAYLFNKIPIGTRRTGSGCFYEKGLLTNIIFSYKLLYSSFITI